MSVRPGAVVEPTIASLIEQHGGVIREEDRPHFAVFVGHLKPGGNEGDGWVLGGDATWERLRAGATPGMREVLELGRVLRSDELASVESQVERWETDETNVDGEPINRALLALVQEARNLGGEIFIQ